MKQYLPLLQRCPLLSGIPPQELMHLLTCLGGQVVFQACGSSILHQGDPAHCFGLLLSGQAQIIRGDTGGSHTVIAAVDETELFAEAYASAALEHLPVNVVAVTDCLVLLLEHRRVISSCSRHCSAHFKLIAALLNAVSHKNIQLNQKLEIVMQRTTRDKLLAFLRVQQQRTGQKHFQIPFDRQALADYLGVDRSAMSTELGKLKSESVIDFQRSTFKMLQDE